MVLSQVAKLLAPPLLVDGVKYLLLPKSERKTPPEWEFVPEGWSMKDSRILGWNVESIVETQRAKWPQLLQLLQGPNTLGIAHEAPVPSNEDFGSHNILMSYAFVLALAARRKDTISLLDWGGGLGQYYVISKAILPDLDIDYHCRDLSLLCRCGRELLPGATFHEDDEACFKQSYDLILVSGSLQFSEDWQDVMTRLASISRSYIFVTRLPIVHHVPPFVTVQRPYRYGYHTEYLNWSLNRDEFLRHAQKLRMQLIREFLFYPTQPHVAHAPEQPEYRGFLFRQANTE